MRDEPQERESGETGESSPPTFEPPHPNGAVHHDPPRRRHAPWEFIILALFVLLVCVGIILGWTLVGSHSPEKLDAQSAAAVAAACNRAQAKLKALPDPDPRGNGTERAARVRAENVALQAMVAEIATVHPKGSTPAAGLAGWTKDWSRMIDARAQYARVAGGARPFDEPEREGAVHLSREQRDHPDHLEHGRLRAGEHAATRCLFHGRLATRGGGRPAGV